MKNGGLDHLGHVTAVRCRSSVRRITRGKADLVIDDDVDRAAGVEPTGFRKLEGFGHDALSGEGRITVNEHGQNLVTLSIAPSILPGPHGTLHDGIDDLQMRRIESKRDMDVATRRANIGREALVIFDVTGTLLFSGVVTPFELRK